MKKNFFWGLSLASIIVLMDQYTKSIAIHYLYSKSGLISVTSFFNLTLTFNPGISFGLFSSNSETIRATLIFVTITITCLLIWWLGKAKNMLSLISLGLIIGGAIGNILDRVLIGAVVDFLDFHVFGYHWPTFNLADTAICSGALFLLIESYAPKKIN